MNEEMGKAIAEGMKWVSKITTSCFMMAIPPIIGFWIDNRFETTPICAISGLILGFVGGLWYLINMTKEKNNA